MAKRLLGLAACLVSFLLLAKPASADFVIDPVAGASCTGFGQGALSEPGPATAAVSGASSVTLTGDVDFVITDLSVADGLFSCVATFSLDVTDAPIEVTPVLSSDFKFVLGGGSAVEPIVSIVPSLEIVSLDTSTPIPELGGSGATTAQAGNGLSLVNDGFSTGPFVLEADLLAGADYGVDVRFDVFLDAAVLAMIPAPVATVEYGGITAFDGFGVDFLLPEAPGPSMLGSGVALLLLLARRRAAGTSAGPRRWSWRVRT